MAASAGFSEPEPVSVPPKKFRVLFVCLGNICRSPAAETVFRHYVAERGFAERFEIDSAGTAGYHTGQRADHRMIAAAAERGLDVTSRARMLSCRDLQQFDLIVVMDRDNYRNTISLAQGDSAKHVKMLSEFLEGNWPAEVPDPYHGGDDGFRFVLDMLEAAAPKILESLIPSNSKN